VRSEDDLIDYVFFNNFEWGWLPCPEKLSESRIITRILETSENEFIVPECIFFSHSAVDNCKNALYLRKFS